MKKIIGLPPRHDRHILRIGSNVSSAADVSGYRLPQFKKSLRRTVVGPSCVQCTLSSLHDVRRSWKVWFTNLKMNNGAPLGLQCAGTREHLKRGFSPDPLHTLGKFHAVTPFQSRITLAAFPVSITSKAC